jgi:hypothetical protein
VYKRQLSEYSIEIDKELYDLNDYPKNIIGIIREKVCLQIKKTKDETTKAKLNILLINLSNLYIEYEDAQDELEDHTNYLFELIDKKFSWLDEDDDFIQIAELLDKISKAIGEKIQTHIEAKRKFYVEYIETTYKLKTGQDIIDYNDINQHVKNYIKNYLLKNFGGMFDQICLDVLESNGITDQSQTSAIISLYYDYTKQMVKLLISLDDIDTTIFNKNEQDNETHIEV